MAIGFALEEVIQSQDKYKQGTAKFREAYIQIK
jgi:hypothetical protein